MSENLLQSPLHARHEALGAKFAEFGGWAMPLQYADGGAVAEHTAVRTSVGIFDVSHLGKALVKGPGAMDFLNRCLANDLRKIGPGQAQYTLCCNAEGGVIDDLIAYVRSEDEVFLIPNASNNDKVIAALEAAPHDGIEITNLHRDYAVLAIQGTKSDEVLDAMGLPTEMEYYSFATVDRGGWTMTVCRTGYTGEKGFELVVPAENAEEIWDAAMAAGKEYDIRGAGLAARDTLRLEMGYPLHGHDLSPNIIATQCRVGWAIGWKKDEFFGAEALKASKAAGPKRTLRGLVAKDKGIPRDHMIVKDADGNQIGEVTSGNMSITRKVGIALALIDAAFKEGDEVVLDVRGRNLACEIVKPPFVTPGVKED
ncbi:MAG: glycine cleavage system aminomethyltransferase GcvT [Propionibacteriaceae bacterium]